jgi:hypothetical protein
MPVIFSQNTGRVVAVEDRVAQGAISMGGISGTALTGDNTGDINFGRHRTIITRIGMSVSGNYQFLHTIGQDVYVYVFGDRMGQITIHGLSFSQGCEDDGKHGFELLYDWYNAHRIANNKFPVTVTIGTKTTFRGFITALNGDVQDPLHRTIQFQLTVAVLPSL